MNGIHPQHAGKSHGIIVFFLSLAVIGVLTLVYAESIPVEREVEVAEVRR